MRKVAVLLVSLAGCTLGGSNAVPPPIENAVVTIDASIREGDAGAIDLGARDGGSSSPNGDAGLRADAAIDDAGSSEPDRCLGADASCELPANCTRQDRGGHAYFFCADSLTWGEARARCQMTGTDLVVIDDVDENGFVASQLASPSWIGANDIEVEGTWGWIVPGDGALSGAPVSYESWADTKPDSCGFIFGDQDCGRISSDGTWDDSSCDGGCTEGTFAFVCESY